MLMMWLVGAAIASLLTLTAPGRADATACSATGSFAGLEAAGSCTIGDKTFGNFTYTPSQTPQAGGSQD
jgi:hypothetical protein